jgi:hypothetical protein
MRKMYRKVIKVRQVPRKVKVPHIFKALSSEEMVQAMPETEEYKLVEQKDGVF